MSSGIRALHRAEIPNAAVAIDVSAADHACKNTCVGIYVGTTGTVVLDGWADAVGTDTTFTAVPAGTIIPGNWKKVDTTSTATNMVELYFSTGP